MFSRNVHKFACDQNEKLRKGKGIEVEIDALPVAEASTAVDNVDIVLLGPHAFPERDR